MEHESIASIVIGCALVLTLAMFSSCTYYSAKDHNACVVAAKTAEIAKNCERAR